MVSFITISYVVNFYLQRNRMRGILSEGMIMCASSPEKVEIIDPPEGCVPGDRVTVAEYPGNSYS